MNDKNTEAFLRAAEELAAQRVKAREWMIDNLKLVPSLHPVWSDLKAAEDAFDRAARPVSEQGVSVGCVTFTRELIGGHELCVTIPGLGTVGDQDTMALWKQMAEKLDEIAISFKASADEIAKDAPQA